MAVLADETRVKGGEAWDSGVVRTLRRLYSVAGLVKNLGVELNGPGAAKPGPRTTLTAQYKRCELHTTQIQYANTANKWYIFTLRTKNLKIHILKTIFSFPKNPL